MSFILRVYKELDLPLKVEIDHCEVESYIDGDEFGDWVQYTVDRDVRGKNVTVEVYVEPNYVRAVYDTDGVGEYICETCCADGEERSCVEEAVKALNTEIEFRRTKKE